MVKRKTIPKARRFPTRKIKLQKQTNRNNTEKQEIKRQSEIDPGRGAAVCGRGKRAALKVVAEIVERVW